MTKDELRKIAKAKREEMSAPERAAASLAMTALLLESPLFASARTVFSYVSMPGEADTKALIDAALSAGKTVCVPRCSARGTMNAVPVTSLAGLKPGAYGIPEPGADAVPMDPKLIDLAIVPCLMAGRNGERLGHGEGYYDRFLASCPGETVCLCFEQMLTDGIPMDRYDVYMRFVLTERGWIKNDR